MPHYKDQVELPEHSQDCTGEQLETFEALGPTGTHEVTRCLGCGAHRTVAPAEEPLVYGSDEWADAWVNDKDRICRHLARADYKNPKLNPLHPMADTWPNGERART